MAVRCPSLPVTKAGDQAAARIQAEAQKAHADTAVVTQRAKWAMAAAVVCSVAALAASVSTVVAIWIFGCLQARRQSPILLFVTSTPEVRVLSSTGITRLHH